MENDRIIAPFDKEQVQNLNFYQKSGVWHPFTCGNSEKHPNISPALIATEEGWKCRNENCDYTQGWAWKFMTDRPMLEKRKSILSRVLNP